MFRATNPKACRVERNRWPEPRSLTGIKAHQIKAWRREKERARVRVLKQHLELLLVWAVGQTAGGASCAISDKTRRSQGSFVMSVPRDGDALGSQEPGRWLDLSTVTPAPLNLPSTSAGMAL